MMRATVFFGLIVTACLSAAHAAGEARPGLLITHRPSAVALYFTWLLDGDSDRDAHVGVEYRKKGREEWQKAAPGVRARADASFTACVGGLEPQTEYECRLTLSDPDGVQGEAIRTVSVRTTALHEYAPNFPQGFAGRFARGKPVLRIKDGDTVLTTTALGNAARGPVFVEGAEPGDALAVRLESLEPEEYGRSTAQLVSHVLDPQTREANKDLKYVHAEWKVDPKTGIAAFTKVRDFGKWDGKNVVDVPVNLGTVELPVRPMIGTIGVALDVDESKAPNGMSSGTHGGNMDWSGTVAGVTMYFPVAVPGALLCLGDAHALQGDGEITNEAIEIGMKVRFTAWTVKGWKINWPRGEDADYIFAIGCSPPPLDRALQAATSEIYSWLQTDYKLDRRSAAILMGVCLKYEVGNIVDPAWTMVCKVPKSVLRRFGTSPNERPWPAVPSASRP